MIETYVQLPFRVIRFVRYTATASASSASAPKLKTVHHPLAIEAKHIDYTSLEQLIREQFPPPPRAGAGSGSGNSKPKDGRTDAELHRHFDLTRRDIAAAFFSNCPPTNSGITNYSADQNAQLNEAIRSAADEAGFTTLSNSQQQGTGVTRRRRRRRNIVEMGSGTGRLVPLLASMFCHSDGDEQAERKSTSICTTTTTTTSFEFNEPLPALREAAQQVVDRTFRKKLDVTVRSDDAEAILARRTQHLLNSSSPQRGKESAIDEESDDILVCSGVAQYLSDFAIIGLLHTAGFSKAIVQEDVCGLGQLAAVYHERDGSYIRSDTYFEEALFKSSSALSAAAADPDSPSALRQPLSKILAKRQTIIEGCITNTYALSLSQQQRVEA